MLRLRSTLAVPALGLLSLLGCGTRPATPDIRIGLIAELTGDVPAVGTSCKNAAEMAVFEINEAGGFKIDGKHHGLGLVIEDNQAKGDLSAAAAKRLIEEEKVVAIVGPNLSIAAVPAAEAAETSKVPLITPWATSPGVTLSPAGTPRAYVFRACFTDPFEGHVLAKFAEGYMRARKAAVLYDATSVAPKSQAELFRKDFEERGGKVVAFETYKTGDKDFKPQLQKIKAESPDLIFLPSYYNDVPLQLKQAHELGLKGPFLGSDNWSAPELIKLGGKDAEGAFFCGHYSPAAKNETTGRFVVSYQKRFHGETPDDVAALTYDSFGLLKTAIEKAGKFDRDAIREALSKLSSYEGVTGKMTFRPGSGDPVKSAVMKQVQDGKTIFITNIDP